MTKIKVIRKPVRKGGGSKIEHDYLWDVYQGFTGMPSTFPFCTKWVVDKKDLTKEEVDKYLQRWMLDTTNCVTVKIKD